MRGIMVAMRRETMMTVAVGVLATLLPLPAPAHGRETAEAVAFAARALADQGKQAEALQRLERWLRTAPAEWRANDPNVPVLLLEAGRYAAALGERQKAITHLGQAVELARKHFAQSPAIRGQILREVARVYDGLGDYARSAPQYQAAVSAFEHVSKLAAAEASNGLGIAQLELLRPADAASSLTRALTFLRGAGEPDPATEVAILVNLSNAELGAGRLDAAADAAGEATQRAGDTLSLLRAAWLAEARVRLRAADMAGAEALLRRVIATTPAGEDEAHAHARFQLSIALFGRGLFVEAEQEALAAEVAYVARFGPSHPIRARVLHTLGTIYHEIGDLGAAEALYKQAISLKRAAFGAQSAQVQSTEIELAALELQLGKVEEGERRARASIAALRSSRLPDRRLEGLATVVTGLALEQKGDARGAVERYREAQRLIEEARGRFAQELGFSLVKMGRLLTRQRRYGEAETALARAIGLYEQLEATGALRLADALIAMAELRQAVGNERGALRDSRRAFALLKARNALAMGGGASGAFEARSAHDLFGAHAALVLSLAPDARAEAFEASELALSSVTGFTVQQVAARFSVRDDRLGQMIRNRQDAFERVSYLEQVRRDRLARPGSRIEPALDAELRQWRETLATATAELDHAFPEYQRLVQPTAVALDALQAALREGEAVLMPLVLESETIVWFITARSVAVHRNKGLPRAAVGAAVARIRRSVDLSEVRQMSDLRPFDFAASDMIYKGIIHPFGETLATVTQLLFIPDGALQSLPPHLLAPLSDVVDARDVATYGRAEWLGLRIPVSIAPSASAIVATRATNRPSAATRALLGFGDPVFSGARRVPAALAPRWAAVRAGTVKRRDIASLQRLPQTRDELNAIAQILGADRSDLFLGDDASERWLGAVRTDDYRVVSFASHALMPGELPGLREPAIVLTPDPEDDSVFDGLLTPAEIAQLRLDADLVILSACNTAAADGSGLGEGLSGLGRAFFFAGARSLLVSHWAVESTVTPALIADVVARVHISQRSGFSAALREAMKATTETDVVLNHPAFWAAFVVVGS